MCLTTHTQHPDHPDHFNRRGYVDMALRIYGGYAPSKFEIQKETREESLHISIEQKRSAEIALAKYMLVYSEVRKLL